MQHTFFLISRKNNFARAAHSHCRYIIFMFFFQRNWSPLLFISRSSSFPVIQVNVDWWKERLFFFFSTSPGGHMIYRRNERGAWSAKISPQLQHTPPPTSWLLTSLSLPQSLYGQRSVVRWRHNKFSRMDRLPNFLNHGASLKTPHQRLHACVHTRKNKKQTNKTRKIGCEISFAAFFYGWAYMELMVGQEVLTLTGLI